ncbi:MAG: hypothetical protein MPN21_26190 [Thermoanaerobaculia bacterium]|nr:hypothetical protein [Thermoanaerobaculia bacterium]
MRIPSKIATWCFVALLLVLLGPLAHADDPAAGAPGLVERLIGLVADLIGLDNADYSGGEPNTDPEGGPFVIPDG